MNDKERAFIKAAVDFCESMQRITFRIDVKLYNAYAALGPDGVAALCEEKRCSECEEMPDSGTCEGCGDTILTTKNGFKKKPEVVR